LPVLICDTDKISAGDEIEVNLTTSTVSDLTNGVKLTFGKIPKVMVDILNEGGLIPYITKHGDFKL
jgi:3-isopropylmalate/(R)-2-methylmalate dehydratase small subunit